MTTPHKWAEVIKAWADGKEIQFRPRRPEGEAWEDFFTPRCPRRASPDFNNSYYEWRIKPEKKSIWINIYPYSTHHRRSPGFWSTKEQADDYAASDRIDCIEYVYKD